MYKFYIKVVDKALRQPNRSVPFGEKEHLKKIKTKMKQNRTLTDNDIKCLNRYTGI